jgi:WD40 repeat protein
MYRLTTYLLFFFISSKVLSQKAELIMPVGLSGELKNLTYSDDGKYIFTTSEQLVQAWDYFSGQELIRFQLPASAHHTAFNPVKRLVAYSDRGDPHAPMFARRAIVINDLVTRKAIDSIITFDQWIVDLKFSRDGKYLFVADQHHGSTDSFFITRYLIDGWKSQQFGCEGNYSGMDVYPDGEHVAACGARGQIYRLNFRLQKKLSLIASEPVETLEVSFGSDENQILSLQRNNRLVVWQVAGEQILQGRQILLKHRPLMFSRTGQQVIVVSVNSEDTLTRISGIVATLGKDYLIQSIDFNSGKEKHRFIIDQLPTKLLAALNESEFFLHAGDKLFKMDLTGNKLKDYSGKTYNLQGGRIKTGALELTVQGTTGFSNALKIGSSRKAERNPYHKKYPLVSSADGRFEVVQTVKPNEQYMFSLWDNDNHRYIDSIEASSIAAPKGAFISENIIYLMGELYDLIWDVKNKRTYSLNHDEQSLKDDTTLPSFVSFIGNKLIIKKSASSSLQILKTDMQLDFALLNEQRNEIYCGGKLLDADSVFGEYGKFHVKIYDAGTLKLVKDIPDEGVLVSHLTISPDKNLMGYRASTLFGNTAAIHVINFSDHKITELKAATGDVTTNNIRDLNFSDNSRYLISTRHDRQLTIFDLRTQRKSFDYIPLQSDDWIVRSPSGLFDASAGGMDVLYFVVTDTFDRIDPWKIIELKQLKHRYYQPGLLSVLLGVSKEKLREVPDLGDLPLPPKVILSLNGNKLTIRLKEQSGGIGRVSLFLDNSELLEDLRGSAATRSEYKVDLLLFKSRWNYSGPNTLKVVAYNAEGWLSSRPETITFFPALSKGLLDDDVVKKSTPDVRLFAIVVGTSDYAGTSLDLRYAAKDAFDFSGALKAGAENLFGREKTRVVLLTTDSENDSLKPTRENIERAFREIAKEASANDQLVVYFSGHGLNYGGQDGDFYYLTTSAASANEDYFKDPLIRKKVSIGSYELTSWINQIPSRKKLLIFDACASGRAAENLMLAMKDVPASQVRALDRMADRTGLYVLSGSAADAVSYESTLYGQGLLTYAILKAMKGAALRQDGDEEYVDIQKLLHYVVDEVPKLAEGIGGLQQPLFRSPSDQKSYDLGKMDFNSKKLIVLAEPKPVFVASSFINQAENEDDLGLTRKINAMMTEISSKGKHAELIFTEAKDYPGAWRLSGSYNIIDDKCVINFRVRRENVKVDGSFIASSADIKQSIANLIDAVISKIKLAVKD